MPIIDNVIAFSYKDYYNALSRYPDISTNCPDCLTDKAFAWAYMMVQSRGFDFNKCNWKTWRNYKCESGDDEIEGIVFRPFYELVNHHPIETEYINMIKDQGNIAPNGFVLKANRDFEKDQEIRFAYSISKNIDLLFRYGFIIDKNLDDSIGVIASYHGIVPIELCNEVKLDGACNYRVSASGLSDNLLYFSRVWGASQLLTTENPPNLVEYMKILPDIAETGESRLSIYRAVLNYRFLVRDYIEAKKFRGQLR